MSVKIFAAPMGGFSLTAGSILLLGTYFYVFLGAAPVSGVAFLYSAFELEGLITPDGFNMLGHMAVHGLLTLGLCRVFEAADRRPAIAAALMGIGIAIEVLQDEFFGRQFQVADMVANASGIGIALVVLWSIARQRGGRPRQRHRP